MEIERYVYDIECDGLLDTITKIHCVVAKKFEEPDWLYFVAPEHCERAFQWLQQFDETDLHVLATWIDLRAMFEADKKRLIAHNQLGYDLYAIQKILDINLWNNRISDTLVASWYLDADQLKHGLEYYGQLYDKEKVAVENWDTDNIELYLARCKRDVEINEQLYSQQRRKLQDDPGLIEGLELAHLVRRDMVAQEMTGVCFDKSAAEVLLSHITTLMESIENEVHPLLGDMELPKSQQPTFPKRPFKKNGDISASGQAYLDKMGITIEELRVLSYDPAAMRPKLRRPITLGDARQVKTWLINMLGWEPTLWSYNKGITKGKGRESASRAEIRARCTDYAKKLWNESPYREAVWDELDLPEPLRVDTWEEAQETTIWPALLNYLVKNARMLPMHPQYQDLVSRQLCPNLEKLGGPLAENVRNWMSYNHRKGLVQGWLAHPRLEIDGRLPAGSSGVTNTHRQKHVCVVNVPKAQDNVPLGREMRALFIAPPGWVCVGCDASQLEARGAGEAAWDYDGGEFARIILEGDWHSQNAAAYSEAAEREISRQDGKAVSYGTLYGCGAAKAARMLGVAKEVGKAVIDAFWDANPGLKAKKEALETEFKQNGEFIRGIDGRRLCVRGVYSLLNTYIQSMGAIILDRAWVIAKQYMPPKHLWERVGYWHDEYLCVAHPNVAKQVGEAMQRGIIEGVLQVASKAGC